MRVPNKKQVATIRVEGEFPAGLEICDFEFKSGWKIDFKKDEKDEIVRATWTGKILPYQFVEFGILGIIRNAAMMREHCLPEKFHEMKYEDFLQARRGLMAKVVRETFESL
jgi:hypothetical protein